MKRIALIGCTGSIGRQTVEIVRQTEGFCFSALVSGRDRAGLFALEREFSPRIAHCALDGTREDLFDDCDIALIAASGFAGLSYTLQAVKAGKRIALANKESLVCGGELVMREMERTGAELIPVDSEHSAIFQALGMRRDTPFEKLTLTASGGPFLGKSLEEMKSVTVQDALAHPTWRMGAKITVDSATMLNKGYEIIEAKWLFGAPFERIEAVVHPESIVHSVVTFQDGSSIAQLGYPDMKLPIQLALTCPERLPCTRALDFASLKALHFERLPEEKFPAFTLALQAGKEGGTSPAVLNGAAEEGVAAFLTGRISFLQIAETIQEALARVPRAEAESYEAVAAADLRGREEARRYLCKVSF